MASNDLDGAIERSHTALHEIINGDTDVDEGLFGRLGDTVRR